MTDGFKPRVPREYVGHYRPRCDGRDKAAGRAVFLEDLSIHGRFPRLLYAKVLRSPYPHARIRGMDTSEAEALPGVKAVLRYDDPEVAAMPWTSNARAALGTANAAVDKAPRYLDRHILNERVLWVGDEAGVVVAAETEAIANRALELIQVDWEVLPFVLGVDEALAPDAPILHPEMNPAGNLLPAQPPGTENWGDDYYMPRGIAQDVFVLRGDVEKALAEADVTIEVTTDYHRANHVALDSMGCLVEWNHDGLTCWTNSYQADQTRMHLSEFLQVPLSKVRVICNYVGGSFGRWNVGDQRFFIFTALLAKRTGRPVRFKHTRREDFHDTRQPVTWTGRMGGNRDGTVTAIHFDAMADSGAYAEWVGYQARFIPMETQLRTFFHVPNCKMECRCVYTNHIPGGMMRSTGNIQLNLCLGVALDMLAERLDLDPLDLAKRNFGHFFGPVPNGDLAAVLEEGARRMGWSRRKPAGQDPRVDGTKKRGLGFSFHMGWHAEWEESTRGDLQIAVRLNPDMSVILVAPTAETGGGSNTCSVLACAESLAFLGVKPEDVTWLPTVDTTSGYYDAVQTDSAVSYLHAEMMPLAAEQIRSQILAQAAPGLGVSAGELDIEAGRIFVKANPSQGLAARDLLWRGSLVPILATVSRRPNPEMSGVPYMANFAEVEVDIETGRVEVLRLVVVDDVGTVMFPAGAEGQQVGGQAMALGEILSEEIVYDRATGIPLSFNLVDYKVPTMLDVPDVEPVVMEVWRGKGEYGACGLGEGVMCPTPAAVLNAVYNATGVRLTSIPLTPDKVLQALAESKETETLPIGSGMTG
jgi:xanthine dehydrogenase molybdenum-binding subunit